MPVRSVAALGAALLFLAPAALTAEAPVPAPAPVETVSAAARGAAETVDAFHSALRRGDSRAALGYLADDALVFEDGRVESGKAEYAAHHAAADAAFAQAVAGVRTRRIGAAGADSAWIATESRVRGEFRGRPVNQVMTETMALRRSGERWEIVHIHWSSAPASTE